MKYSYRGPMGLIIKILFPCISLDHNPYQMTLKVTTLTIFINGLENLTVKDNIPWAFEVRTVNPKSKRNKSVHLFVLDLAIFIPGD